MKDRRKIRGEISLFLYLLSFILHPLYRTGVRRVLIPGARTSMRLGFALRREHVVVHADDHRDENYGVVEKMQLNPGNPKLYDTSGNRRTEKIMPGNRLP